MVMANTYIKYDDIEKIYQENKDTYQSMQDVINKEYIVPLNRFRHSVSSRFIETINLVLHKEKKSILKT